MNIERFIKNPALLADLCREVVVKIDNARQALQEAPESADMEAQLREIAKTIDRLEKISVPIPDVLRAEKTRLAAALGVHDDATKSLELLADSLGLVLREIRATLQSRKPQPRTSLGPAERVLPDRVSRSVLRKSIISSLQSLGGSASMKNIFKCMAADLEGKLLSNDLVWLEATKRYSWQEASRGEREKMIREGLLRSGSPIGIWELSEERS